MIDFLSHYYREGRQPFESMSCLSEHDRDRPYFNPDIHGEVFTLPEMLSIVEVHGIPDGEWETDPAKSFDFLVEAQVWSFRPPKKYIDTGL